MNDKEDKIGVFLPDEHSLEYDRDSTGQPKPIRTAIAKLTGIEAFMYYPTYMYNEKKYKHHEQDVWVDIDFGKYYRFTQKKLGDPFRKGANIVANTKYRNMMGDYFEKNREVDRLWDAQRKELERKKEIFKFNL